AEYREPCAQCAAVDWGISDEGHFYCRSCHNVIERTREVMDMSFTRDSNRISWISKSGSDWGGSGQSSTCSMPSLKRSRSLMTMEKTLALIHLALVWSREALTLSDLLRLVKDGHVPYVTAYEQLPEEMKLRGQ
ncbi:hypothetical protein XENOCAPTIV_021686, partial [Xenoophorus captivus]